MGDVTERSRQYLLDYYEQMGEMAEVIADSALRSPQAIKDAIGMFTDLGVDELILDPTVSDPDQVDLLAGVVL